MFILFHEVVFDPNDLTYAQATESSLHLVFNGNPNTARIWTENGTQALHLLGELYQVMLETGIALREEEGPEIELDGDELEMLQKAMEAGYMWIARDKDGKIYAYRKKPVKRQTCYEDPNTTDPLQLERDWFAEIDFEAGPQNIDFLLADN